MAEKQFQNDKNYILKNVQNECRKEFLINLIRKSVNLYEQKSNSLKLNDSISKYLRKNKIKDFKNLNFFYRKLSAIYRFNHGETQLRFLWDGSSHEDHYRDRWRSFFADETEKLINNISILKMILSVTVFNLGENRILSNQYKLSSYIRKNFNAQVFKRKGVINYSK
tara:strand:+ start:8632 stop:9132 length:501 start_codon:yes stop_codon:yes gene_type:complete